MILDPKAVVVEIDEILRECQALRSTSIHDDLSDLDDALITDSITSIVFTIERFAPPASQHIKMLARVFETFGPTNGKAVPAVAGILSSLRTAINAGRLKTLAELIHADLFGNFLDMSQHLLDEGYKDAAAVLAGGTLEGHLKKLCDKHNLALIQGSRPKKADSLNSELAGVAAYSKSDQKNVTAWLSLRNESAHGNYAAYSKEQVGLLIQSVRDFISRIPA